MPTVALVIGGFAVGGLDDISVGWDKVAKGFVEAHAFVADEPNPVVTRIKGDGIFVGVSHCTVKCDAASFVSPNLVHFAQFDVLQVARPSAVVGIIGSKFAILSHDFQAITAQSFLEFAQSDVQTR